MIAARCCSGSASHRARSWLRKPDLLGRRSSCALGHPPSGVRSPSRPSGRKTRIRIRIENTIDSVQSEPGACQLSPSLNAWMQADQDRAEHGAGQVADAAEHGGGERDQPELKPWSKRTVVA